MDSKKQIEEIAKALLEYIKVYGKLHLTVDGIDNTAILFAKFGITKLPEDSIVLSREEYDRLLVCEHNLNIGRESYRRMEERAYKTIEELNQELVNVRKETVREILTEIQAEIFKYLDVKSLKEADNLSLLGSLITYDLITDKLHELAHQHDVEIGE